MSTSTDNYRTHKWTFHPSNSAFGNDPTDPVTVCSECGCEDRGDPAEFPELEYPNCEEAEE